MRPFIALLLGMFFGIVLVKSEVASWFRIQKMFHFQEAHMYLVIGSAVVVGALSIALIRALNAYAISGESISFQGKDFHKGTAIGGALFGLCQFGLREHLVVRAEYSVSEGAELPCAD